MEEWTIGQIFNEVAEKVAEARTHILMGEPAIALQRLRTAQKDYLEYSEVLASYPGSLSLSKSMEETLALLLSPPQIRKTSVSRTTRLNQRRKAIRSSDYTVSTRSPSW